MKKISAFNQMRFQIGRAVVAAEEDSIFASYRALFLTSPPKIWLSPRPNSKIEEKKLEYGIL